MFDDPASHLTEFAAEFLGPRENAYFSTLRFARRQQSYLLGRYAAKLALRDLLAEPDLRAIEIVRGVFEQPVVQCARSHRWCVSISHADSLAVVVAFPAGHPMALDAERIDLTRYETILSQLSNQQTQWIAANAGHKLQLATALWTAKEALSKVLCTGLMSPVTPGRPWKYSVVSPSESRTTETVTPVLTNAFRLPQCSLMYSDWSRSKASLICRVTCW